MIAQQYPETASEIDSLFRLQSGRIREEDARLICPWCRKGTPHRQLAESSIGGPRTRTVRDLHDVEDVGGVGIQECLAYSIWQKIDEETRP